MKQLKEELKEAKSTQTKDQAIEYYKKDFAKRIKEKDWKIDQVEIDNEMLATRVVEHDQVIR